MSTLRVKYGNLDASAGQNSDLVYSGVIDDADPVDITLDPGCMYHLITYEWTASSEAYRGSREVLITVPNEILYGSTAVSHVALAASTNSGVSITYNNDSTITLARSAATYAVRYAVVKIF